MVCSNVNTRNFSKTHAQRAILNPARLAAAQTQKDILTRAEAAAYLNIDPHTLMKYVKRGVIPCCKLTRRVIFSRKALERWVMGENNAPEKDLTTNDDAIMTTAANGETETKEGAEQ